MFWGLIMEPNKRYTQVVGKPFHISQAAMDISTGDNDPCQVMVVVDGKNFLVCTLQKNRCIQVPLDLYFKAGDSLSFLTNGKCNVHLTGYLDPEFEDEESDEEAEEEEVEDEEAPQANKRKLENGTEGAVSKKAKPDKRIAKKEEVDSSDSDDEENELQKFLEGEDIDTDENDESFKVNSSLDVSEEDDDDDDDEDDEDEDEDDDEDDEKDDSSEKADTTLDTSVDSKVDQSKLSKSARRRLKKKMTVQKEPQVANGVEKAKKAKPEPKENKAEKKKEVKKDVQEGEKKEKKSLSGGVFIEDIKVGSGPVAKPGKVVMVYYEGRLKQNNKMFDNCQKGPGFRFKLGAKEVISGWDVGVAGMKVGGKRKIVCPPPMAYGAKGSPPTIPPNSTLVFEVELKNVK
ncbi:unnamed protein product [Danaus chrysippus]|uniref:FK506-binding protein n=1 Tax=Danaus chrysippus TaxID=151541 RepID=A0A8J2QMN1_9NEOP|nr:unnamed protein product [Danaus chrysippus]